MKNIIMVRFANDIDAKRYAFILPNNVFIKKGTWLVVEGKKGLSIVECVTDSAVIDETQEDMIMNGKKVITKAKGFVITSAFHWGDKL